MDTTGLSESPQKDESKEHSENCSSEVEPSNAECEEALKKFVQFTKTDEACAHFFLQDFNWQLQPALDRFFSYAPETKERTNSTKASSHLVENEPDKDFSLTVMSWNIDGLDESNLTIRFTAVCYIISKISADVVFLQEMTPDLVPQIRKNLGGEYSILVATPNLPYFTVVLLKPFIELISHKAIPYGCSGMGRSMQLVETSAHGHKMMLLNTHLESMKEHSDVRLTQIQECFEQLTEWDDGKTIIVFGGDLNARDSEIGELPPGFKDAWVAAGSKPKFKFTWDTLLNDNKAAGKARCRFDRIIYKSAGVFSGVDFSLEGQNRIRTSLCFPSDHWAILVHFH
ncbi:endonuclease/Exonuclease/phosphatase [Loa loa]|uniref:Endonuclease/Exonuclease/phosphatase n=1 Tax=Loa loa TaxID=7209 RepID=A0A1I7W0T2_LOALO|nr:endonuclease/Exonuclease/phosphatase [Loa loa]EFO24254.2 endonuclease/Exonuclease/phosphatase [Loa loa]